jgi:hypothetical protein
MLVKSEVAMAAPSIGRAPQLEPARVIGALLLLLSCLRERKKRTKKERRGELECGKHLYGPPVRFAHVSPQQIFTHL